jgi:hypothetical protein
MMLYLRQGRERFVGLKLTTVLAVILFAAVAQAAQVTLAWNPNTETNLAGYKLNYGTASGSFSTVVDVGKVTTYTIANLADGKTYYFAATAYNTSGGSSGYSNQVTYTTPATTPTNGSPTTPSAPSGPTSAAVAATCSYSTSATDPNGNPIVYQFNWGDGSVSPWGAASQTHAWTAAGTYYVTAQGRDSLGALSGVSARATVTVNGGTTTTPPPTTSTTYRIWDNSASPAGFSTEVASQELGMKFRSSVAGTVTGVRFYKGSADTGQHVGSLWSRSGQKLASVTFTNETASGWQEARFAAPVAITANTTYVISYHTGGRFAYTRNYFATAGTSTSPVRALADGEDGGNGVYCYGSTSAFPSSTYLSSNYWVDVVFQATQATAPAKTAAAMSAPLAASSPTASTLMAPSSTVSTATSPVAASAPSTGTAGGTVQSIASATASGETAVTTGKIGPAPDTPILSAPISDDVVAPGPLFTTGVFHSADPIAVHAETRWQVFRDDDSRCVFDLRSSFGLTRFTLPELVLEQDTLFFWRAQFIDQSGRVSEWSDYGYFATEAGTDTAGESQTAPATDLDRNGVRDDRQPGFSILSMEGTRLRIGVAVTASEAAPMIEAVASERLGLANPMLSTGSPEMPFGLIHTRVSVAQPGDEATVTLYFPGPLPKGAGYYEADSRTGTMREVAEDVRMSPDRKSITLTVRDGGPGDADGVANGIIVTASGPGVASGAGEMQNTAP